MEKSTIRVECRVDGGRRSNKTATYLDAQMAYAIRAAQVKYAGTESFGARILQRDIAKRAGINISAMSEASRGLASKTTFTKIAAVFGLTLEQFRDLGRMGLQPRERAEGVPAEPIDLVALVRRERKMLGALMMFRGAVVDEFMRRFRETDFLSPAHKAIFKAMRWVYESGVNIDPLTVAERLKKTGRLALAGGPMYLTHLDQDVSFLEGWPGHD